jgi:hypothetical protein
MPLNTDLTGILDKVHDNIEGDKIQVKNIINSLESRGYGPLLLAPALFSLFPTGAIPGVPSLMGITIFFISLQLVIGKKHPWMPQKVQKFSFKKDKFEKSRDFLKPYTKKIDCYIKPRYKFLTNVVTVRFIGLACMALAATMPVLGIVPFAADIPAFVIALYGLGLATRDGVVISLAVVFNAGAVVAIYFIIQNILTG